VSRIKFAHTFPTENMFLCQNASDNVRGPKDLSYLVGTNLYTVVSSPFWHKLKLFFVLSNFLKNYSFVCAKILINFKIQMSGFELQKPFLTATSY